MFYSPLRPNRHGTTPASCRKNHNEEFISDLLSLLAVVQDNRVVIATRYYSFAVRTEVKAVDFVRILSENLRNPETPQHIVCELHCGLSAWPGAGGRLVKNNE